MPKVYLAGPEVFLPDAKTIGRAKQADCAAAGLEGLFPLDAEVTPGPGGQARIYQACLAMARQADVGVFNLTPFRGVGADPGTVYELGLMAGLGKPVFGYTNDGRDMLARTVAAGGCTHTDTGWADSDGMLMEDFGGADNLMVTCGLTAALVVRDVATDRKFRDLDGFRACLALVLESLAG